MNVPFLDPLLFDDPRLNPPRRCFRAHGSKKVHGPHQKTKTRDTTLHVNASRLTVAKRVARQELKLRGYTLTNCFEVSWEDYARTLPQEYVSRVQTAAASHPRVAPDPT